jgi:RNA methyltransferase, TrmH family
MLKITSRDNQRIKFARRVRDGNEDDFIFIEGVRLAEEITRSHLQISDILYTETFSGTERGQSFLQTTGKSNPAEVSQSIFDTLSDTKNSQGIIVIAEKPPSGKIYVERSLTAKKTLQLVILLHQINNPSNLGAILRTCEAVNATGVILTKNSADAFSPKALRGAMGSSLRLPLWTNADFYEVLDWARGQNLISVCADVNAEISYLEIDWKKPHLLIFGSEAHGLGAEERKVIDESLVIPMENGVESLNLAVSSAIILFEAKRQIEK